MKGRKSRILVRIVLYSFILLFLVLGGIAAFISLNEDLIKNKFIESANAKLNTRVNVGAIDVSWWKDFPKVAIIINNVRIAGSIENAEHNLFECKQLRCDFNLISVLNKSFQINELFIENGNVYLFINDNKENNYTILKKSKDTTSVAFKIEKVHFSESNVIYNSEEAGQYIDLEKLNGKGKVKIHTDRIFANVESELFINDIQVGEQSYLKGKNILAEIDYEYNPGTLDGTINPSKLEIDQSVFLVDGEVQPKKKRYYFHVANEHSDIRSLTSLLPIRYEKELSKYQSEGEVYFKAFIRKDTDDDAPLLKVNFGTSGVKLFEPNSKFSISNLHLKGAYTNGVEHNNATSILKLENIKGTINNSKVAGELVLNNFDDPFIDLQSKGSFELKDLNHLFEKNKVRFSKGKVEYNISLKSKLSHLRKGVKEKIQSDGELIMHEVVLSEGPGRKWDVAKGSLLFNDNTVAVSGLDMNVASSDFKLTGMIVNPYSFLTNGEKDMMINLRCKSGVTNIDSILSAVDYKEDTATGSEGPDPKVHLHLSLEADQLNYQKFRLKKFKGLFEYANPNLNVSNMHFEEAGGMVNMNSRIQLGKEITKVEARMEASRIDISRTFTLFDNFNQDFIRDEHLKGLFSVDLKTSFSLDSNANVMDETLEAEAACLAEEGKLIDFEPMQKMARFIDREELRNISFETLENTVIIKDRKVEIPRMQINSSITNITLTGWHTFDQKIDYRLEIPLKDFVAPDKDAAFGAIEDDGARSLIHLKITGTTDDYKVAYDSKAAKKKFKQDLKKEINEFKDLIRGDLKKDSIEQIQLEEEEYFDF